MDNPRMKMSEPAPPTVGSILLGWTVGCCIAAAAVMGTVKLGMVLFG